MSASSTSGLSVELLLRVIDVKYGCFTFTFKQFKLNRNIIKNPNWLRQPVGYLQSVVELQLNPG